MAYAQIVREVEHGSFTPLAFAAMGDGKGSHSHLWVDCFLSDKAG